MTDPKPDANELAGDGRAQANSTSTAFQSDGGSAGPSAGSVFNPDKGLPGTPTSPAPWSLLSGAIGTGLPPTFERLHVLRAQPLTQKYLDNWSPEVALPGNGGRGLGEYSLHSYNNTQVAHGNVPLQTLWEQRENVQFPYQCENVHSQYQRSSVDHGYNHPLDPRIHGYAPYPQFTRALVASPAAGPPVVTRHRLNDVHLSKLGRKLPPIDVEAANCAVSLPESPCSAYGNQPDTASYTPAGTGITFRDPWSTPESSTIMSPQAVAGPLDSATFTPQSAAAPYPSLSTTATYTQGSATGPLSPHVGKVGDPQSPTRGRKDSRSSRGSQDHEFTDEEQDLILYLTLHQVRTQAIGLEVSRLGGLFPKAAGMDQKAKLMGRQVKTCLQNMFAGREIGDQAEEIVGKLVKRATQEGWTDGVFTRAKDYSNTLGRGRLIASDAKERIKEAKARGALKKWLLMNPNIIPRENAKVRFEKMAFDGMMLDSNAADAAVDREKVEEEEFSQRLLEFWEKGTVCGKAVK